MAFKNVLKSHWLQWSISICLSVFLYRYAFLAWFLEAPKTWNTMNMTEDLKNLRDTILFLYAMILYIHNYVKLLKYLCSSIDLITIVSEHCTKIVYPHDTPHSWGTEKWNGTAVRWTLVFQDPCPKSFPMSSFNLCPALGSSIPSWPQIITVSDPEWCGITAIPIDLHGSCRHSAQDEKNNEEVEIVSCLQAWNIWQKENILFGLVDKFKCYWEAQSHKSWTKSAEEAVYAVILKNILVMSCIFT